MLVCYDMTHADSVIRECGDRTPTLESRMGTGGNQVPLVCIPLNLSPLTRKSTAGEGVGQNGEPAHCLGTTVGGFGVAYAEGADVIEGKEPVARVRRLTPRECERLQGFPDDWTLIPYRGKPADKCPDAPRYKAIGNSWAVPVVRWIGRRINRMVEGDD